MLCSNAHLLYADARNGFDVRFQFWVRSTRNQQGSACRGCFTQAQATYGLLYRCAFEYGRTCSS